MAYAKRRHRAGLRGEGFSLVRRIAHRIIINGAAEVHAHNRSLFEQGQVQPAVFLPPLTGNITIDKVES